MRIAVTAEDIAAGRPHNCEACPIAIAATRAAGEPMGTGTATAWTYLSNQYINQTFELPGEARGFVRRYDAGLAVRPFEFELPNLAS